MTWRVHDRNGPAPVHVWPNFGPPHETETTGAHVTHCWCGPRVEMDCPSCHRGEPSCWRCNGKGWVPCDDPGAYDGPIGLVVIHNAIEETDDA